MRPISPPSASTSCTSCDLAGPPTAGLHGCRQCKEFLFQLAAGCGLKQALKPSSI